MPELPEVETVVCGLRPKLTGRTVTKVTARVPKLRFPVPKRLKELEGQSIEGVSRRGKYGLIHFKGGMNLLFHLGMSGKMMLKESPYTPEKHDHILLELDNKTTLVFNDARRFGLVDLFKSQPLATHALLQSLGVEPLGGDFTPAYLYEKLKPRKLPIKQAIMDSKMVVGIGNIYASEALYKAGIYPGTPANRISKQKVTALHTAIQKTLNDAIKAGGSSLKDYVHEDGSLGYFQHTFYVYGRDGETCKTCGTVIKKMVLGQRSTFYCPACQRL